MAAKLSASQQRLRHWIHFGIQLLALVVIFVLVNYMSCRHYSRTDLTGNQIYTLSENTKSFLKTLSSDANIIVAYTSGRKDHEDLVRLVEEYRRHGNKHINVEFLDPAMYPDRASEILAKYRIELLRNAVILTHGERAHVIYDDQMLIRDNTGLVRTVAAETLITSRLMNLVEGKPHKVYLMTGGQSAALQNGIKAELAELGKAQNMVVDTLNFTGTEGVPNDADLVVIAAPKVDLTTAELAALNKFWRSEQGAIFIALDPEADTPRLEALTRRLGVIPRDDRLVYASRIPGQPLQKVYGVPVAILGGTSMTRGLDGLVINLGERTQSLELLVDDEDIKAQGIALTPLLVASNRFWGETDYRAAEIMRDRTRDNFSPLFVGAAVQKGDPNLPVSSQRMVIVSNATILSGGNQRQKAQTDFVMASLNWLLDRSEISGPMVHEATRYATKLPTGGARLLNILVVFVLPLIVALASLGVWMLRRN